MCVYVHVYMYDLLNLLSECRFMVLKKIMNVNEDRTSVYFLFTKTKEQSNSKSSTEDSGIRTPDFKKFKFFGTLSTENKLVNDTSQDTGTVILDPLY